MGLPVLSSDCVQLLWTPWAIWRGQRAYDSTTLAPLALAPQKLGVGDLIIGSDSRYNSSNYYTWQNPYDSNCFIVSNGSNDCKVFNNNKLSFNTNGKFVTQISKEEILLLDLQSSNVRLKILNVYTNSVRHYNIETFSYGSGFYEAYEVEKNSVYVVVTPIVNNSNGNSKTYVYKCDINLKTCTQILANTSDIYKPRGLVIGSNDNYVHFSNGNILFINAKSVKDSGIVGGDEADIIICNNSEEFGDCLTIVPKKEFSSLYVYNTKDNTTIQTINNVQHLVNIDKNNIYYGDGFNIFKAKWNSITSEWETKNSFNIGVSYSSFGVDPTGTLWVRGNQEIFRVLPGQGISLVSRYEEEIYKYLGKDIPSNIYLSIKDSSGRQVSTKQNVILSGPVIFEDGSTAKIIEFSSDSEVKIPVVITGPGNVECNLSI